MRPTLPATLAVWLTLLASLPLRPCLAQDEKPASPLVRLLQSGRVPAERQGTLIDQLGKRGTAQDLSFLLEKTLDPKGFAPAERARALRALEEAAATRKVVPASGTDRLPELLGADDSTPEMRTSAVRLAGLWKVGSTASAILAFAENPRSTEDLRVAALDALANLGRVDAIRKLTAPSYPHATRLAAAAALARLAEADAPEVAAGLIRDLPAGVSPTRLIAAVLDRRDGGDLLADAFAKSKLGADAAKVALRSVYELGRTDARLVSELTKAAGLSNEVKAPTQAEIDALIAEVQKSGNAERGERIFRRADVNCMKCHALTGAGGGVGPELSALGATSPVDYLIYSILVPDQSIKEEFQTHVFLTADGRVLQGIVVDKDDARTIIKEATGDLRTIAADEVEESKLGGSLMPKGLTNFLTRAEFVDLLRFLSELGKPGPYAIRSVPTIQRWRLLTGLDDDLGESIPGGDVFASRILAADDERWKLVYAMVDGRLPLDELTGPDRPKVLYLQGEIDVSAAGAIRLGFDDPAGVAAWLDEASIDPKSTAGVDVEPGRKKLTVRVDTTQRKKPTVRVEVARGEGSSAEYRVVGGR
ncbi:MAG: c-type cytochrome [Isosphaeraceae bacterium]|nr:c-type cytochrome [Isosphaeraceae bacterium]